MTFVPEKKHFREVLIYFFNSKKSAAECRRLLVEAYGENTPSATTCRKWFQRFKAGDFAVLDKERTGQPKKFTDEHLRNLLEEDPNRTLDEISKILNVNRSTVGKRLHSMGMIKKIGKRNSYTESFENVDNKRLKSSK